MNLTISKKLGLLIALAAVVCITVVAAQLLSLRGVVQAQREALLKAQVQSAVTIAESYRQQAVDGHTSMDEAKAAAKQAIGAMRYGHDDYFFVTDYHGTMLVHTNPKLIGQSLWDMKDPNGYPLFQHLIQTAQNGGGITPYLWPRNPKEPPVAKLSYSAAVPDWGWMVGTGVYVDDLNAIFWSQARELLYWSLPLLVLLVACGWPLAQSISRPINRLTEVMRRLAAGDRTVAIPGAGPQGRDRRDGRQPSRRSSRRRSSATELEGRAETARQAEAANEERQAALDRAKSEDLRSFVGLVEASFDRLSDGDLTVRMEQPVAEEFEPIRGKFNESVEKLEGAIGEVVTSIGSIRTGLGEISTASSDLASRTEQQAASLEETVAALGEVAGGVNQTAEGAGKARAVASGARDKAVKGGEVVQRGDRCDAAH